jgi:SNF2 family DNA or RNA helicase
VWKLLDEIFEYQRAGASWLSGKKHALLADEMGLGKSAQVVLSSESLKLERILVICPAVTRINWQREFKKWGAFSRDFTVLLSFTDIPLHSKNVICSFEYATQFPERLRGPWDLVVIDETHFLKSIDAKRSKHIFGKDGLVHKTERVWTLSGTPAPNHAGELWILLYVFGITNLKYDDFIERYCVTKITGFGVQIVGTKKSAIPELRGLLSSVMLRRRKTDVLKDLPQILFTDVVVEPGAVDFLDFKAKLEHEKELLESAFKMENPILALEGMAKSVSTLRRYTGLQKMEPVSNLIRGEMEAGLYEKLVIFAIHKDVIAGLFYRLSEFNPVIVNGDISVGERQSNIDAFQKDPNVKIFIGNIGSAGTGITLTASHQVLFCELDWVPGNNAQAAMRCHRIGQTKPVTVRFVSLDNPMDERVTQVLKRKAKELSEIFESQY